MALARRGPPPPATCCPPLRPPPATPIDESTFTPAAPSLRQAPARRVSQPPPPPSAAVTSAALLQACRQLQVAPVGRDDPSDATLPSQKGQVRRSGGPPPSGGRHNYSFCLLSTLICSFPYMIHDCLSVIFLLLIFLPLPFLFYILSPDLFTPTLKKSASSLLFFSRTGTCSFGEGGDVNSLICHQELHHSLSSKRSRLRIVGPVLRRNTTRSLPPGTEPTFFHFTNWTTRSLAQKS